MPAQARDPFDAAASFPALRAAARVAIGSRTGNVAGATAGGARDDPDPNRIGGVGVPIADAEVHDPEACEARPEKEPVFVRTRGGAFEAPRGDRAPPAPLPEPPDRRRLHERSGAPAARGGPRGAGGLAGALDLHYRPTPNGEKVAILPPRRFDDAANQLYGAMNNRLYDRPRPAGADYAIAGAISRPWTAGWKAPGRDIAEFPHFRRRFDELSAPPAAGAGTAAGRDPEEDPAAPGAGEKTRRRAVLYDRRARPAPG